MRNVFLTLLLTTCVQILFAQDYELVWSDEFESSILDETKWNYNIGNGCPDLCGWGNNELEYYREENVSLSNGNLILTAKEESYQGYNYTSGKLTTYNKSTFTFGKFEARMKLPKGQGIWPAFWLLYNDPTYGIWPLSGEIDIMEIVGHDPDLCHGTIHYGGAPKGGSFDLPFEDFSDDFHVFTVEWDSTRILWFVDGIQYAGITKWGIDQGYNWPFDHPFQIILNVAVGGNWPGSPDATTTFPQTMEIDWVRVYQKQTSTALVTNRPKIDISIYPNPVKSGLLQIDFGTSTENRFKVVNSLGQVISNHTSEGSIHIMDFSHLPSGLYTIEGQNKDNSQFLSTFVIFN